MSECFFCGRANASECDDMCPHRSTPKSAATEAGGSARNMKLPDADWLRRKVESDPDVDVEAFGGRPAEWREAADAPYDVPLWGFRLDAGLSWSYGVLALVERNRDDGYEGWYLWDDGDEIEPPRLWMPAIIPPRPGEPR